MKLTEFNDTVELMRTVYPFKDEETELVSIRDIVSNANNRIEIYTVDKETDTEITMSRSVKRNEHTNMVNYP